MEQLKKHIRHVPDYPKPGILFYDITTLLLDPEGFREMVDGLTEPFREQEIDGFEWQDRLRQHRFQRR